MIPLSEIKQFFEEKEHYPEYSNDAELIQDGKRFVESHIAYLESNAGKQRYKPYYDRLLNYYEFSRTIL